MDQSFERGQHTWRLVKSGTLGFSYGYLIIKADKRQGGGLHITELDIFEVTATPIPANTETQVLAFKSAEELREEAKRIEREAEQDQIPDVPEQPEAPAPPEIDLAQELQEVKAQLAEVLAGFEDLKKKQAEVTDKAPRARSVDPLRAQAEASRWKRHPAARACASHHERLRPSRPTCSPSRSSGSAHVTKCSWHSAENQMNRFEKRKVAIEKSIREHIDSYKAIYKKADDEDRDPTDEERLDIESQLKAIEILKTEKEEVEANIKTLEHVDDIGRELGPAVPTLDARVSPNGEPHDRLAKAIGKSLGEQFTDSDQYKSAIQQYRESGNRFREGFSTGAVALDTKGTLLEGVGSPAPARAAGCSRFRRSSRASWRPCSSRSRSPT